MNKKQLPEVSLNEKQMNLLYKLSQPHMVGHHPKDGQDQRTLNVLIRQGLVEEYHYSRFLHGAVRLTEYGKQVLHVWTNVEE